MSGNLDDIIPQAGVKTRSKILLVLIFLLILGFIFLLPHGRYRHAVEAYKKELLARGEKLTIAELVPPPSSDASNGAKAFMQLMSNYREPTNLQSELQFVAPGLANVAFTNIGSAEMLVYEQNRSNVAELCNVLNRASDLDFDLDYSSGFKPALPHLLKLKMAALLISGTAMQAYAAKDFPGARMDLLASVNLFRLYSNEPIIISDLVRANLARIAAGATWEGLQCDEWTDPQLAELQNKWEDINLLTNATTAIATERAWEIAWMAELRRTHKFGGQDLIDDLSSRFSSASDDGLLGYLRQHLNKLGGRARFWRWKTSWSYDEELRLLQLGGAASDLALSANATGAFLPGLAQFNQQVSNLRQTCSIDETHFLIIGSVSGATFQSYNTDLLRLAETETVCRLTVTAIALKRYHLQHGDYPWALHDLVPAYLSAVPNDFLDGRPLRYRLRPDGDFLLYSVGEDGEDNGGNPSSTNSEILAEYGPLLAGRDIVWPRVATPAALEEYHRLSQSATNSPAK